jgi:ribonuclease R
MNTTQKKVYEGIYTLGKNGVGYVRNREFQKVFEIPLHHHGTALNKDIVEVTPSNADETEAHIVNIVRRAKSGFSGILNKKNGAWYLEPEDTKIPDIKVENENNITEGNRIFVTMTSYEPLLGTIDKDLGHPKENDGKMNAVALEYGFDFQFPKAVEKEAEALEDYKMDTSEIAKRRDIRDITTFTIDPADAKDFDDALSFVTLENGNYQIGIHIADVSHYVKPGSALDDEAQERTTSVYLVDRTIPMLPEILSNGLCSLRQDEDKYAFSAMFEIVPKTGEVVDEWFGRTVIRSDKRFTYQEAQEIINNGEGLFHQEISEMNRLAKIYSKQRENRGSINFETQEVKFILDEKGKPIRVQVKQRVDTMKMIEEFMLLANESVAKFMKKQESVPFFVYRVHDRPEPDRMKKLKDFLTLLGYDAPLVDQRIPTAHLQKILHEAEGTPAFEMLQTVVVRSMQKAVYTTKNIGHYGLAFDDYTHFTSPIRRYPDVLAHRLLQNALDQQEPEKDQAWYEKMCAHCSEQEQRAVTAERNSIKMKQVEYMASKDPNEKLKGVVTGASKFGVFIAEQESLSEGMIRLSDLGNDFWKYDEKTGTVFGEKTKKRYKIGDIVDIKIKHVDEQKHLIDYIIDGVTPRQHRQSRQNNKKHSPNHEKKHGHTRKK